MDQRWNCPSSLRENYPFEAAAVDTMLHLAHESGPFHGEGVMERMRPALLKLVQGTLYQHCREAGCTLCTNDPDGHHDIDQKTGEIVDRLVFHDGNPNAEVMFVGEGPGIGERNTFVPLVGCEQVMKSKCVECMHFCQCFKTIVR